jgi:dipeptidyl aminopeptidase/acylaminoacyl peptidase
MNEKKIKRLLETKITIPTISSIEIVREGSISPDGKRVAYFLERNEYSNIWSTSLEGGISSQVTFGLTTNGLPESKGPAWSHDGELIVFTSVREGNNDIYVVPSEGGVETQLTTHNANDRQPRWSPESTKIAFTSNRNGSHDIYAISLGNGAITPIIQDTHDNENAQWSPDGSKIACISRRGKYYFNHDILVVPSCGGEYDNVSDSPDSNDFAPDWSPDGTRIAFLSDRDGYGNIYIVSVDRKNLTQLTTGKFDLSQPRWSPDGSMIAYLKNNVGDIELWVVPSSGGNPKALSILEGVHGSPAWTSDGKHILINHASPIRCSDLYLISLESGEMKRLTHTMPPSLEKIDFVKPKSVVYKSYDGLEIQAFLFQPNKIENNEKLPAIVNPHGGPTGQYVKRWDPFVQYLVQEGYVVLSPNFRGGTGQGKVFQDANDGDWGGGDLQDNIYGAKFLRDMDFVDGKRIGIYGGSYGGYMTLLALTKHPNEFKIGINLYGVTNRVSDWDQTDDPGRINFLDFGDIKYSFELFKDRSAVNFVDNLQVPLLIIHGENDPRVPYAQSTELVEILKEKRKVFEFVNFAGEEHGIRSRKNRISTYRVIEKFLKKWL